MMTVAEGVFCFIMILCLELLGACTAFIAELDYDLELNAMRRYMLDSIPEAPSKDAPLEELKAWNDFVEKRLNSYERFCKDYPYKEHSSIMVDLICRLTHSEDYLEAINEN